MSKPTSFTPVLAERICQLIASGKSLRDACKEEGMPGESTVRLWVIKDYEGFAAQYARAREEQAEHFAEDLISIADDMSIPSDQKRIMVDARKWTASKILPKRYGDKVEVEHSGGIKNLTDEQVETRLAELLARAQ